MDTQVSEHPTKTAHIGHAAFEIPAFMTMAKMVECWQHEAEVYESFVNSIVENHPRLASDVAHAWVRKHEYYLISKAERFSNLLTFQPEAVRQMKTIYPEFYAEIMASEAAADATKAETEKVERFKEKQHKFTDRLSQLDPEDRKLLDESMDTIHRLLSKLK